MRLCWYCNDEDHVDDDADKDGDDADDEDLE